MADDQFQATGNWWESARNAARFEAEASQSSSSALTTIPKAQAHDLKPRPSACAAADPNLHMMGLGLSSQPMDWNQPSFLRGDHEKGGGESSLLNPAEVVEWREKLFSAESSSSTTEFKQVNRGFSLDQHQFSPQYSSGDSTTHNNNNNNNNNSTNVTTSQASNNFQMELYGNNSILQGLLAVAPPDHHHHHAAASFDHHHRQMNFGFPSSSYGGLSSSNDQLMPPAAWSSSSSSKVPPFLRASPPKPPSPHTQLHFANNAPFWNATSHEPPPNIKDVRSNFFPSLQPPFPAPNNFDVQPKNMCEVRESAGGVVKKSGSEGAPKRPRSETPSPLPAFKVRKEKMGDRITALQQLVSPFGKTDTASVLSEAIEYIKFLHEQVTVLSTPYMKSGAPIQHQQSPGKSKEGEGTKQDLRSRGLCLVPVSSTFPVTHETTVDFWTPTFGGTFR
ncbi:transcription factor bHLH123 [Senna tora]|uniref:Transcription factor bHLH123 n=1 Tax=Senna tora TaxID=362788 RepID=A0A834TJ86_9FABA|nr:transcription factor bHLH123 [Senna tora]